MNIKRSQKIVGVGIVLFIAIILFLGWVSSQKISEVVTDTFNQQQLVLARSASIQIKNDLDSLKGYLSAMSDVIEREQSISYLSDMMKMIYIYIKDKGGLEVKYIDRNNLLLYCFDKRGFTKAKARFADFAKLVEMPDLNDEIYISEIFIKNYNGSDRPLFNMVKKLRYNTSDNSKIKGMLIFTIDAYLLTSKTTKDIISGNTGHAFVIDQKNHFLYHHEKNFIGRDSIAVRKEKGPGIPFEKIDNIQNNHMLKGEEGTDWYISGWHRGEVGHLKKLIAYTPVYLNDKSHQLWSVAVVAPVTEVEGAIQDIQFRQFLIQLSVIFGTMILGLFYIFILLNWSTALQDEVSKKTHDFKLSEERYKSLVENADDIIFTVDHSGKYLSMNKYGCKFFNKTLNEIIGQSIENIVPNPFHEVVSTMVIDVFTNKESVKFTHFIKIGENEYWLNTIMRRLYDEAGNTYAVLGISRDITVTKKKEIEEQMYHTEKLASMGTLAAGVAHEINNPLAIILGFSDLLLERYPPESDEYGMLKTIEKHALNAKKVVQGLLSFARYTDQKEEVCDLNKDIELVLNVVKNALTLNNIKIVKELQSELPTIKGDPGKFQQVFLNLINNSIHAMKEGGTLSIKTKLLDSNNIEIRFSDTGDGIAPEHRNKIFDPLFTTKKVGEGTGLGLSVCYGIISQHGGKITFETKTKEESSTTGTTFIITLPVAR